MHMGRLTVGILLATAASTQAFAATPSANPRRFDVIVTAEVDHDTNLPRVSAADAALRHQFLEDTTYLPSVNVDFAMPVGRQSIYLNGSAGYSFHERNSLLDSERLNFEGGANLRLGRCGSRIYGNYQRSLSDFEDITSPTTITNILEIKKVGVDLQCQRRTGLGFNISGGHEEANNDATLLIPQDHDTDSVSAGLTYNRPALGIVTIFGSHATTNYPNRQLVAHGRDGFDNDAYGITIDRHLGARIEGTVTVSYTQVKSKAPAQTGPSGDFSGVTYSASLVYRPTHKLRTGLLAERNIVPSNRIGNNYDLRERYRIDGSYQLNPRISASLGYERRNEDSSSSLPPSVILLTHAETDVFFGGVRYDLSRHVFLTLDAAQEDRTTNNARFDYDDTHVALAAHLRY